MIRPGTARRLGLSRRAIQPGGILTVPHSLSDDEMAALAERFEQATRSGYRTKVMRVGQAHKPPPWPSPAVQQALRSSRAWRASRRHRSRGMPAKP